MQKHAIKWGGGCWVAVIMGNISVISFVQIMCFKQKTTNVVVNEKFAFDPYFHICIYAHIYKVINVRGEKKKTYPNISSGTMEQQMSSHIFKNS